MYDLQFSMGDSFCAGHRSQAKAQSGASAPSGCIGWTCSSRRCIGSIPQPGWTKAGRCPPGSAAWRSAEVRRRGACWSGCASAPTASICPQAASLWSRQRPTIRGAFSSTTANAIGRGASGSVRCVTPCCRWSEIPAPTKARSGGWRATVLVPQGNDATLSNGLAWSPDGRTMYHSHTMSGDIYAWDYEPATGEMTRGRLFAHVDGAPGPDGAEVDSEGFYWSAINGQGRILRFDPDGRIEREIAVPFKYPTMIAFGGADLRTAFVTSGRWAIADKDAADHPLDGGIFAFDAPAPGLPTSRWAGITRTCPRRDAAFWRSGRSTIVGEGDAYVCCRASYLQPLCNSVGHPQCIGDDGQRRVDGADRGKEAGVRDIKIVEFVRLAVEIQHGCRWIGAEAAGAGLVRGAADRDVLAQIKATLEQVRLRAHRLQQAFQLALQPAARPPRCLR